MLQRILSIHIEDESLIEGFLNTVNAANAEGKTDVMHKTRIVIPERGDKKALLKMASEDEKGCSQKRNLCCY